MYANGKVGIGLTADIFYLRLAINYRLSIGKYKNLCIATRSCSGSACFKGFLVFKAGITKMGENIYPSG